MTNQLVRINVKNKMSAKLQSNFFFLEINWNRSEGDDKETKSTEPRLFKSSSEEPLGMDSLTIIWYLTTFAILFGFFVVMACTEKACNRSRSKPPETRTCPPTPCPSYKNFAPPGYDTVMKKNKAQRVFIVPVHEDNNFFSANLTDATLPTYEATTTVVDVEKCAEMDR